MVGRSVATVCRSAIQTAPSWPSHPSSQPTTSQQNYTCCLTHPPRAPPPTRPHPPTDPVPATSLPHRPCSPSHINIIAVQTTPGSHTSLHRPIKQYDTLYYPNLSRPPLLLPHTLTPRYTTLHQFVSPSQPYTKNYSSMLAILITTTPLPANTTPYYFFLPPPHHQATSKFLTSTFCLSM